MERSFNVTAQKLSNWKWMNRMAIRSRKVRLVNDGNFELIVLIFETVKYSDRRTELMRFVFQSIILLIWYDS